MGFLISCVRRRYEPGAPLSDPDGIDPKRWTALAMRHRVLPIVYTQLSEPARGAIKDLYLSNSVRNMARAAEMRRLADACGAQGIPVMFLRGPVLASTLYRDPSLRQFTDLDVLVHEEDVPRVSALLISDGYQAHFRMDAVQEKAMIRFRAERCFIRSGDQSTVDLHWRLLPGYFSFEPDEKALWSRGVMVNVEGSEVRTLGDEDLFLFLCAHGAKHGWDQLALLCDVAEMMRVRPKLNWDAILRRSQRVGKQRMLLVGMELVREVLGVSVPVVLNPDQATRAIVDELKSRLAGGVGVQEGGGGMKWSLAWRMMERCRDRLSFAADLLLVPTGIECERLRLPQPLFFVYYLFRLGRMAKKLFMRTAVRTES